jgi:head-tail adaptor
VPNYGIIDGRMLKRLNRFYPATCTIQHDPGAGQSGSGQPNPGWTDLPNHVALKCSVGPPVHGRQGTEIRRPDNTVVRVTHRLALRGRYASITERMRAVVAGKTYNIVQVVHDSRSETTSLDLELVTT